MKKLTKKSLDELAEVMPVISEKKQQECVGGYYFVDENGSGFLQTSTGGDLIVSVYNSERDAYWASGTIPTAAKDLLFHPVNTTVQNAACSNILSNIDYTVNAQFRSYGEFATYDYGTNTMYINISDDPYKIAYKSALEGEFMNALVSGSSGID